MIGDPVCHFASPPLAGHEPLISEDAKMLRYQRLRQVERVDEFVYALLAVPQLVDDRESRGVAERLQELRGVVEVQHMQTFAYSHMVVNPTRPGCFDWNRVPLGRETCQLPPRHHAAIQEFARCR